MRLQDYDTAIRYLARLESSTPLTPAAAESEVRELVVELDDSRFQAVVGQNVGVLAPGRPEMGQAEQLRLYSLADVPVSNGNGRQRVKLCVRRCSYIDEYSGERYPGRTSNYLCDLQPGDTLTVTGPYGPAFEPPSQPEATLIMIGAGTGIAPFRAFVKHLHARQPAFTGRILLFHGARTGLELLYRNREKDDFSLYADRETFEAIDALSARPGWSAEIDWAAALQQRAQELSQALSNPLTFVYVAGLEAILEQLDAVLAEVAGSSQTWREWKTRLQEDQRWVELVY